MKKILSFIVNENSQILLLRNNSTDSNYGGDFWYTVTGGFDPGETDGILVSKREIKEETNLDVIESIYLNLIFLYNIANIQYEEYVYVSFVNSDNNIVLNEENVDYKWCNIYDFVKEIKWYGDRKQLTKILELAVNKKLYFNNETTEICSDEESWGI